MSADPIYRSVYYTLNPVKQTWLDADEMTANAYSRAVHTTKDSDIDRRKWLLLDFDPVRPGNTSSTDAELEKSEELAYEVANHLLREHNWPRPLQARSGNGFHLLYRIDAENTNTVTTTVEFLLKALSQKFSTEYVHLDTAVGNAARICKAYGSVTRKGKNDGSRPWRDSEILNPNGHAAVVTIEQLEEVADLYQPPPGSKKVHASSLHPDFDMDDFLEHYDLDVRSERTADGVSFYHLANCPFKGAPHTGAPTCTSLQLRESGLGFNCFHPDCAAYTLGDLFRLLHDEGYDRYPHPIWKQPVDQWDESIFRAADGDDEMGWSTLPTPKLTIQVEETPGLVLPLPTPSLDIFDDTALLEADGLIPDDVKPYEKPDNVDDFPYALPAAAMYGWLAAKTLELDAPLSWSYPAMLTVYASNGVNEGDINPNPRPTLFTVLLAAPEAGKSVVMDRACASLPPTYPHLRKELVPSSDRGLMKAFKPRKDEPAQNPDSPDSVLLWMDEMLGMMSKAKIQNSSLTSSLCSLFYKNSISASDKTGTDETTIKLNVLGGLPVADESEFAEVFGAETKDGLHTRFLLCPGPSTWKWNHRWKATPEVRKPSRVRVGDLAHDMTASWVEAGVSLKKKRGRVAEIAMRIALISAAANGDRTISAECMKAALLFAEWQESVREKYKHGESENMDGKVTEAILNVLEGLRDKDKISQWVPWWKLANSKGWTRKWGSPTVTRVKASLIAEGTMVEQLIDPDDSESKRNKTGYVRLRNADDTLLKPSDWELKHAKKEPATQGDQLAKTMRKKRSA
jgi:hypothetical protein